MLLACLPALRSPARSIAVLAAIALVVVALGADPAAAINNDASPDAVFANLYGANRVCLGDASGGFAGGCANVSGDTNNSPGVALGLVDNDPYVDAVFANFDQANRVCLGDASGSFTGGCANVSADTNLSSAVALGYVNADVFLDAVFANSSQANRVCLGDVSGTFTGGCANVSGDTNDSYGVALGYVNNDVFLDAVFTNRNHANRVCFGDASGGFSGGCADVSGDANNTYDVGLGFLNGDAFVDAVFANKNSANRVCMGDASGGFTGGCSNVSGDTNSSVGLALGHVNGDAFVDAVFANEGGANRVCLGDASGGFSGGCTNVSGDTNDSQNVSLGLMNSDAFLDAVFANWGDANRVCLGDASGGFTGGCSNVSGDTNDSIDVALSPARGTVIIEKVTDPPGAAGSFDFLTTINGHFALSHGETHAFSNVVPNTLPNQEIRYDVTEENLPPGFILTDISCDDTGSANPSIPNLQQRSVDVQLDPGETVTCTFTNTKQTGTIVIEKVTDPPGAGGSFLFAESMARTSFALAHGQIAAFDGVSAPGAYNVTEVVLEPGFTLGDISCDDGASSTPSTSDLDIRTAWINLDPDETVICTFTNEQKAVEPPPTAATIVDFAAETDRFGRVSLSWTTGTEAGVLGFYLHRADVSSGEYGRINERLIPTRGGSTVGAAYAYRDQAPPGIHAYRLEVVRSEGTTQTFGPVIAVVEQVGVMLPWVGAGR